MDAFYRDHNHTDPEHSDERQIIAHHSQGTDAGYNGWDLSLVNGHLESRLYRVWPGNALGIRSSQALPTGQWIQIAATYDGSMRADGLGLWLNGQQFASTILRDKAVKQANVAVGLGGKFILGQRFRSRGFKNGQVDDLRVFSRNLSENELISIFESKPREATKKEFLIQMIWNLSTYKNS